MHIRILLGVRFLRHVQDQVPGTIECGALFGKWLAYTLRHRRRSGAAAERENTISWAMQTTVAHMLIKFGNVKQIGE